MTTLISYTRDILTNIPETRMLFLKYFFSMVLNLLKWYFFGKIGNKKTITITSDIYFNLIMWIFLSIINSQFWVWVISPAINEVNVKAEKLMVHESLKRYSQLSMNDKNNITIEEYHNKMNDAKESVFLLLDWGLPNLIELIIGILSCLLLSWSCGFMLLPIMLLCINVFSYIFILKKAQKMYSEGRKERLKERTTLETKKTLRLPMFAHGELSVDDISELYNKTRNLMNKNTLGWMSINTILTTINNATFIILIFIPMYYQNLTVIDLLKMISLIITFNNNFENFTRFLNRYDKLVTQFDNFTECMKDVVFEEKAKQFDLPKSLTITNVYIKFKDFILKSGSVTWKINKGDKILVHGPSGSGKSTFINGLIGKIAGISLTENDPKNYSSCIMEYYQTIRETTSVSSVSLKELFVMKDNDLLNNDLYNRCAKICMINDWIEGKDYNEKINNQISGGQKSRLLIAVKLYQMLTLGKKILILDEPEQGSDPPVAYEMLKNIIDQFQDITIFVISHLERIQDEKFTGIHFDKHINIKNGHVNMD